jgi:hypothetical protein
MIITHDIITIKTGFSLIKISFKEQSNNDKPRLHLR